MSKITLDESKDKDVIDEWFEEAKKQTLDTLPEFMRHLTEDYIHDYGTIVHAMSACMIAAGWAVNESPQGGITGFQSGFIKFGILKHWDGVDCPIRIVKYDDMLYPQYDSRFENTISQDTWEYIQEKAHEYLNESEHASDKIIEHWKKIVEGEVPFGYTIRSE